jgi:hypothetical protein
MKIDLKKILAISVYICYIPVGISLRILERNRCKLNMDKKKKSYRCKPDKIKFSSQKLGTFDKTDDDSECPDTLYPMW